MLGKNNHYYGLDLLRGISGYGVAVTHFFAFIYGSVFCEYMSFIFVEFFFVLSGFVLYPQLLQIYNNKKNLLLFYKRRWLRTLPVYFFSLIVISLITNKLITFDFVKYFFLVQDIYPKLLNTNFFPIVWSLSIEEFFYIIFPLFILFFKKENLLRNLLYMLFILILGKIFLINSFDSNFIRTGTLFRFDAILLGFMARYFYKKFNFNISFIISVILIFMYTYFQNYIIQYKDTFSVKFFFIIFIQITSLFILLLFTNIEGIMKNKFLKKFSNLISKQTYSVYLFHMIYIYLLTEINFATFNKFIVYILLLFASSTVSYYYLEKPILEKRPKLI
ncbi:acyltransferase [Pelagibacteraceae bacterium]|nr:acyltransferase [Pelagibacteraceae bacterium]